MSPKTVKDGYDNMHAYFARVRAREAAARLRRWVLRAYWGGHLTREILVATNETLRGRGT